MMNAFWQNLQALKDSIEKEERVRSLCTISTSDDIPIPKVPSRDDVLLLIENAIEKVLSDLSKGEAPSYTFSNRNTWNNISFLPHQGLQMKSAPSVTSIRFDSIQSVSKFALMTRVLSMMYKLLLTNSFCTKREMFYQDPGTFGSQAVLDDIVDNISCMLSVPRWELHVLASSKGMIAGSVQFRDCDGNYVDCRETDIGILVPNHVEGIKEISTEAKLILVVEKDATFQKLLDDDFCHKFEPCIIITGKGFPDVNTRLFLRKLWDYFHIPTLALVDADPHGIEIMTVYKYGSRSLSFEAPNLTLPAIQWLGIHPSDIQRFSIPPAALLPLTQADTNKAHELLKRPFFSQHFKWKSELEAMLGSGTKAEIQCLSSVSSHYLTDVYLPTKLRNFGWL